MAEYEYENAGNSEAQQKVALSRLFAQTGTLAATGVLGGLVVTQASTANGTVLIASGSAVVHPSMTVGASLLVCDSQKTLDIFTANPMGGLPRNDIVAFDSITATLIAITGTPNATPTDPTVPNTSVALARLRHAASATTIPTAKIDTLIVATTLRGVTAAAVSAKLTTNSAGFYTTGTGGTGGTGLLSAPSITGDGVKKFKITVNFAAITSTGANDTFNMTIEDQTLGTALSTRYIIMPATAGAAAGQCMTAVDVPAVGAHVYRLSGWRSSGTGVGTLPATTAQPIDIIVEQIA